MESPENPNELLELTVPLEAQMNLGMVTDFDADKLDLEKWMRKYGYKPYCEPMSDEEFFRHLNLNAEGMSQVARAVSAGDFQQAKANLLKTYCGSPRRPSWQVREPVPPAPEVLRKRVEPYMKGQPFPFETKNDFPTLFALAYELTGEPAYLKKWLEVFSQWYVKFRPPAGVPTVYVSCHFIPNPWETLITGERSIDIVRAECLLRACGPEFGEIDQRINVYRSLAEHGQFLASMNKAFHPSNWQIHQLAALLNLSLQFPEFTESAAWTQLALKWLGEHMRRETLPDGGHHERCIAYNGGVIETYRKALEAMRRAGVEPPDGFVAGLRKMYEHTMYLSAPGLARVGIGDGGTTGPGIELDLIIDGALLFNLPECKWFAAREPERVRRAAERLSGDGTDEALARYEQLKAQMPETTSTLFPYTGWAVMRSSWEDDALYLVADFGSNLPWHAHADQLGFSIFAHGRPLITDAGTGGYQSERSKKWYKQTIGHNTVLVDGISQGRPHEGTCHRWVASRGVDYLHASHPAYDFLGVRHARRILFVKPEYWIVTDALRVGEFITTSGYHEYRWLAHFQPSMLETGENSSVWARTAFNAHIGLLPVNPERIALAQDVGYINTPEGEVADAPVLSLVQEGVPPADFGVVLFPFRGAERPQVSVTAAESEEGDMACSIQIGEDVTDLYLENRSAGQPRKFGEYLLDGEAGWIRQGQERRLFLVQASLLMNEGRILFSCNERAEWVEICLCGGVLDVFSDKFRQMTISDPGIRQVRFNGNSAAFVRSGDYVVLTPD